MLSYYAPIPPLLGFSGAAALLPDVPERLPARRARALSAAARPGAELVAGPPSRLSAADPGAGCAGLFYDVFVGVVGRLDLEVTFVQLTEHPMLAEGLVVGQTPGLRRPI